MAKKKTATEKERDEYGVKIWNAIEAAEDKSLADAKEK